MKKKFALIPALLIIVGCAPAQLSDVHRVESSIAELRSLQAETTSRISDLEQEIRQLSGRIEEMEFAGRKSSNEDVNALKNDLNQLKRRIPPPANVPTTLLEIDEAKYARSEKGTDLGNFLDEGFLALREGRYENADTAFAKAIDVANKKDDKATVLFWIGVTKEGRGDFKRALEAYIAGMGESPNSSKTPPSLLRQSSVLLKLGETKGAKGALNKLIADYPKSDEAAKAKERLKSLPK